MGLEQDIKKEIEKINKNFIFETVALHLKEIFSSKDHLGNDYYIISNNILSLRLLQKINLVEKKASETMIPTENGTFDSYNLTQKGKELYEELKNKGYYKKIKK